MSEARVVIAGAGLMGRLWGNTLRQFDGAQPVAWVDVDTAAAAKVAEELYLDVAIVDDIGKAVRDLQPDLVVDCTPPAVHREITVRCLEAGVPVLGEKPMAASMDDAREMVRASERTGVLYMVSQSRRYDPRLSAYRRLIRDCIGELGILDAGYFAAVRFGGFRGEMRSPLLLDMAIHHLDAARYISDADPLSVFCEEFRPSWSWWKGNDSATAVYDMTGGLRFTYRGSWSAGGFMTSWEAEWRAVGAGGTAIWDGRGAPFAEVVTEPEGFSWKAERRDVEVDESEPRSITGSLTECLSALRTGVTPMSECHDNIKSLAMVFAAMESADAGQRVAIDTRV